MCERSEPIYLLHWALSIFACIFSNGTRTAINKTNSVYQIINAREHQYQSIYLSIIKTKHIRNLFSVLSTFITYMLTRFTYTRTQIFRTMAMILLIKGKWLRVRTNIDCIRLCRLFLFVYKNCFMGIGSNTYT